MVFLGGDNIDTTTKQIDIYNKYSKIVDRLYVCTTREAVDKLFDSEDVSYSDRLQLLDKCMGIKKTFGTPESLSDEEEYDFSCAVFVEGTWRMLN